MKLAYLGVFLLSIVAFPAAAHRVLTLDSEQTTYEADEQVESDGLFCSDRTHDQSVRPRTKKGVIVKMKPFVIKEVINTETFNR